MVGIKWRRVFTEFSDSIMFRTESCGKEDAGERVGEGEESWERLWYATCLQEEERRGWNIDAAPKFSTLSRASSICVDPQKLPCDLKLEARSLQLSLTHY